MWHFHTAALKTTRKIFWKEQTFICSDVPFCFRALEALARVMNNGNLKSKDNRNNNYNGHCNLPAPATSCIWLVLKSPLKRWRSRFKRTKVRREDIYRLPNRSPIQQRKKPVLGASLKYLFGWNVDYVFRNFLPAFPLIFKALIPNNGYVANLRSKLAFYGIK